MWPWIDLAIVLVAVAFGACVGVSLYGTGKRFLTEIGSARSRIPPASSPH